MRHCGNCGASFEPGTLVNNRCPSCGATIDSTGDVLRIADRGKIDTQPVPGFYPPGPPRTSGDRGDGPGTSAAGHVLVRVDPLNVVLDQRTPRGTSLILALLTLAALLLLIGVAALVGAKWSQLQPPAVATTTGAPNATVPATAAPAVATATSPATVTATAVGQPTLSVDPTQISLLTCIAASVRFQVLNSGGGSLAWTANASDGSYTLSPPNGSLAHNEQQTVTVSNISFSGRITITALGAKNSPQTVTISCTA